MVYYFRVTYEDHEDVYRDIEIKSSQSFLELHSAIQQAIGFDNSKSASFYTSDDYWRKEEEIVLVNTSDEKPAKNKKSIRVAEERKKKQSIADHVNHPHQKFIYVFDPDKEWTFQIELLKIVPGDATAPYPRCVKTMGTSPKQYKPTNLPPPIPEEEEEPIKKEKEEHAPLIHEKDPVADEEDGFIPLNEDGIEEIDVDNIKEPGTDAGEPGIEDEAGESSEEFGFDDEEI